MGSLKRAVPLLVLPVLFVVLAAPGWADTTVSYQLDATSLGIAPGNYGFTYTSPLLPNLTLSAFTKMVGATTLPGTLYFDDDLGVGVQNGSKGGSQGISGDGGDQDEAVIFGFDTPIIGNTAQVLVTAYDPKKDLVGLHLNLDGGGTMDFDPATVKAAGLYTSGPKGMGTLLVDFSKLPGIGSANVSSFYTRCWQGHIYVNGLTTQPVPEPSTMALLLVGGSGLIAAIKRRRRAA